jgi:protein SCO1/2
MSQQAKFPAALLWVIVLACIMAVGGALVIDRANKSRSEIPVLWEVPDFEFVESSGRPFGLGDIKGKINVVDFIFTNCPNICPVMSAEMAKLYRLYSESPIVQFVSISVDPARDTLEALREYAASWGVDDDRWIFLTGHIEEVVRLSEEGFKLPAGDLPMGHSNRFVLVDPDGMIRSYHDSFDDAALDALKANIKELARRFR